MAQLPATDMIGDAAPIIVSALFGREDHAWLTGLRRAHFPVERNHLDAHLTMFHHLPPSLVEEIGRRLRAATAVMPPPPATIVAPMSLGSGVALRVRSDALASIRADLAEAVAGCLTPEDRAGWRPHVTIQNKVTAAEARALFMELEEGFTERSLSIAGLAAWRYRGGPWELVSRHAFTGINRSVRSRRS